MKKLIALFAASAFMLGANFAQAADIMPAQIDQLTKAGTIKSAQELNNVILKLHPNGVITDAEFETSMLHGYVYEVEVHDANGIEWDVHVNAKTGEVISNRQDH
ncbi:PepSY domain-containing protein [Pseudomonas sp. F1_0610]|uniref:PepSY domain-containing protein n=1 Tax=Pseudomonas sp. F1_0610 TaxID=3114284 RepID=UPI0039C2FE22